MNLSAIPGCCRGWNLYNLGGAHGVDRANGQLEFDRAMSRLSFHNRHSYIAITNNDQNTERQFLEHQGWTTEVFRAQAEDRLPLYISRIEGHVIDAYLTPIRAGVVAAPGRFANRAEPVAPPPPPAPVAPPPVARRQIIDTPYFGGNSPSGYTFHERAQILFEVQPARPAPANLRRRRTDPIRLDDVLFFCNRQVLLEDRNDHLEVLADDQATVLMRHRLEYEYGVRLPQPHMGQVRPTIRQVHQHIVQRARNEQFLFER